MKKIMILTLCIIIVSALASCGTKTTREGISAAGGIDIPNNNEMVDTEQAASEDDNNNTNSNENTGNDTASNVFTSESAVLSKDDVLSLENVIESDSWNTDGTADCFNNIEITINGDIYMYHSVCGTWNDEINQKSLALDEKTALSINTILSKYVSLAEDDIH